jgi:hypothetical protein
VNSKPEPGDGSQIGAVFYEEKRELETVLADLLSRPSNMERLLRYICDKYFCGQASDIKEYRIALEAFGRSPDFDPSVDSIVRVEAHRLRNKLTRYYMQQGANHRIHIVLPVGGYVPHFHRHTTELSPSGEENVTSQEQIPPSAAAETITSRRPLPLWISLSGVIAFALLTGITIWLFAREGLLARGEESVHKAVNVLVGSSSDPHAAVNDGTMIRIMAGTKFASSVFTDELGEPWMSDRYFSGGDPEVVTPRTFSYTTTPSLYLNRRRGNFSYQIPLQPGSYELKLHFADAFFGQDNPEGGGEGSRLFDVRANGKDLLSNFDLVSDAGGSNTADVKAFYDIQPASDGYLHLEFISHRNVAFVNAIEVLPSASRKMVPVRIIAGNAAYKDSAGRTWSPDQYFRGGVHFPGDSDHAVKGDPGGFSHGRFGNFMYAIPVPSTGEYTVRLRFCNGIVPNALERGGGNVFNVYLNGATLLQEFRIPGNVQLPECLIKDFPAIKPNAQGKLNLSFVPTQGYASVSSIEVDQK